MLTLCNARVRRGPQILLDEATATIFRGEKIGIVGRNGCGKSTLLALIRGELTPDAGEYSAPPDRKHADVRPCDVGHVHVALLVDDLDAVLEKIAGSGWKAAGKPQTLKTGPNAGKRVVYVRDPDGTTIEFMQPPIKAVDSC